MSEIIHLTTNAFNWIGGLEAAPKIFLLVSLIAVLMGAKVSKAIEGGLKLAIAITGVGAVIRVLIGSFAPALQMFAQSTGLNLRIIDLGWAPLATITWGSVYTLFFLFVLVTVNLLLLALDRTKTLDFIKKVFIIVMKLK